MTVKFLTCLYILAIAPTLEATRMGNPPGYLVGAMIVVILMAYLVYTLIRPEKF